MVGKISKLLFRALIYAPAACFRFSIIAPFRNQSASKATGVKNRGQILTHVKISGGW